MTTYYIVLHLWQVVDFLDQSLKDVNSLRCKESDSFEAGWELSCGILRKVELYFIDQEEFEKICGIGEQYEDLFQNLTRISNKRLTYFSLE
jgi:hypothetical protein